MRALRHLALITVLLTMAGCASVRMGPNVAAPNYAASPKRIYVLNGLDERFSATLPETFHTALTSLLAGCGVTTATYRASTLQLNVGTTIQTEIDAFRADAILAIRQTERVYHEGNVIRAAYIATLSDVALKREVWKGEFTTFGSVFADKSALGGQLAAQIIRQLGQGNIIKTCPSLPPAA